MLPLIASGMHKVGLSASGVLKFLQYLLAVLAIGLVVYLSQHAGRGVGAVSAVVAGFTIWKLLFERVVIPDFRIPAGSSFAQKQQGALRCVVISDTHNLHDGLEIPDGDVLIHCGDFTDMGKLHEIEAFNNWLGMCTLFVLCLERERFAR